MEYEECEQLVDAYSSAVVLSNSADLKEPDLAEIKVIRESLGEFIVSLIHRALGGGVV